jgi:hypothetical protein
VSPCCKLQCQEDHRMNDTFYLKSLLKNEMTVCLLGSLKSWSGGNIRQYIFEIHKIQAVQTITIMLIAVPAVTYWVRKSNCGGRL